MNARSPHIAIVGAGIVGASLAFQLARRGARVTLVDGVGPGGGVTAHAFAWINVSHGLPEPYLQLRHKAIDEWRAVERALDGALRVDWCGALTWTRDPADTERFVREHSAAGYGVRLVERAEIAEIAPALVDTPDFAAFAPGEGAVDPGDATRTLVDAAREAGAELRSGLHVDDLELKGGHVTGIRGKDTVIAADVVVLAGGTGSPALSEPHGVALPVDASPSILIRMTTERSLVDTIVSNPQMEIRQAAPDCLLAAEDYMDESGEDGPEAIAARAVEAVRAGVRGAEGVQLASVAVGWRPMPRDGLPIVGFAPGLDGLYVTAMHAGVTLGPLVGRLAASEILDDADAPELATCRPDRFCM